MNLIQYAKESRSSFPIQIVKNQYLSEDLARAEHLSSTCKEVLTALLLFYLKIQKLVKVLHIFKWDHKARIAETRLIQRNL